jgi:sulfur carrier protein
MVRVNGAERVVGEGATLADLARELGIDEGRPGVAAAVDGEVVPRGRWAATPVREGAAVEVVGAAAGG